MRFNTFYGSSNLIKTLVSLLIFAPTVLMAYPGTSIHSKVSERKTSAGNLDSGDISGEKGDFKELFQSSSISLARSRELNDSSLLKVSQRRMHRGENLAFEFLSSRAKKAEKISALLALSQAYFDFEEFSEVTKLHSTLIASKEGTQFLQKIKNSHGRVGKQFGQYMSYVIASHKALGNSLESEKIAYQYLHDSDGSSAGKAVLSSTLGTLLLTRGKTSEAMEVFSLASALRPNRKGEAVTHYWLALKGLSKGDALSFKNELSALKRSVKSDDLGSSSGKWAEKAVVLQRLGSRTLPARESRGDLGKENHIEDQILSDLELLSALPVQLG